MRNISTTSIAILLVAVSFAQEPIESFSRQLKGIVLEPSRKIQKKSELAHLHIKAGETVEMPAKTYEFEDVLIEAGGTLRVTKNSRQWLIIRATGKVEIRGEIVFRDFLATQAPVTAVAPDGTQLQHSFEMSNIGGDGGDGAAKAFGTRGGYGAHGTEDFGGGGGGFNGSGGGKSGGDASGHRGGRSGGHRPQGDGGDGGKRGRYSNGGLIYLDCGAHFEGGGGRIDVRGSSGPNGEKGGDGTGGGAIGTAWAGGGGGAPGGEGGVVIIKAASVGGFPNVLVDGGPGGKGGASKRPGGEGEPGIAGFVEYR